ncbi:SAGA HAT/Core module component [Saccharomyces pastorianus]|uniref:SAGA HAT/Core module component n=1 Tax=Saccharomyces pastorianus TaxID=27292 RepID=A0A6C1E425_SACPS|nr:SAGA HAT/Core module component [Saccharomyces pastorianus]
MDGYWDVVVSSLQDIYNANEVISFDDDLQAKKVSFINLSEDQLQLHLTTFQEHMENINRAHRILENVRSNLSLMLDEPPEEKNEENTEEAPGKAPGKAGRSYWTSEYNPSAPILLGSEVAYKPRRGNADGEWIQCEVLKIIADGTRFEVRDPEPDESGNSGKVFKCNWKELLLIPPGFPTKNYPPGTKVLARYPETTTFYPAIVIGTKRDGTCRLRFDGEEEVDKETEVIRRLVLPSPMVSANPAKK